MRLTDFEAGYVIACANIVNLHDEPGIAADAIRELGVTWKQITDADLSDYDMAALRQIKREGGQSPFLDGRSRAGRRALEERSCG